MKKAVLALSFAVALAGCPKKNPASPHSPAPAADGGTSAPVGMDVGGGKGPHDFQGPHGIHDAVSRSTIATLAMDAPIAQVDDVTFTRADLERSIAQHAAVAGIPPANLDAPTRDALEEPAYEKLIERKLLSDEARRRNLWPSDDEVNKERDRLLGTLPKGQTLQDVLAQMHSDEKTFTTDVASDVAIGKLFEALKKETPPPPDAEVKKFYEENKAKFVVPDTTSAFHILVAVKKDAKPDEVAAALKKAEDIRKQVAGKDEATFKKVAADKSDDPQAKQNGGDLGTFAHGDMVKAIDEAAFKLKKGEVSKPVRSPFGFHILRGGGVHKGGQKTYADMKQTIIDRQGVKQFMAKVDGLIDSLRRKAKITRLVEPLPSPFSKDDGKGTRVPAWRPTRENALPGSANPHEAMPMMPMPMPPPSAPSAPSAPPPPPGAKAG